ncbi:hypothetical protein EP30_07930 [Bifidobacterium sp. UTCIF-39]|uniref:TRAFAC clade GTPase domain-containing protein n=1 Tax=Bifidobacterium sp. UTCIF-39 TaxID=1465359 RepID=UPI001127EF5E|nr:hypothetical protein [Bifidobacterium sp. UTCIF-39]TPF96347.1 hypothetical protein EP30_07930 [Bifidobacterium sp. UTCIF-39]
MGNTKEQEPSRTSYFYGPGFGDIVRVITTTKANIGKSIEDITAKAASKPIVPSLIIMVPQVALRYIYWLFSAGSMVIASAFICLAMLLPHVIGFVLIDIIGIVLSQIARLFDLLYFQIRKVSNVCDTCHNRFALPVYVCDQCGAKHLALLPGKYGILHHTCTCGQKLACSVLDRKHPRRDLQALCPFCYKAGREESVLSSNSRAICIPVVGGASAGKSAFITAYAQSVIDDRAPKNGLHVRFYDDDRERMYQSMTAAYRSGVVEKTSTVTEQGRSSTISFSFFLEGDGLVPSRLMQILDIAGETFTNNDENEEQNQYEHCEGIVLVIDPLSIRDFAAKCKDSLDPGDSGSISNAPLEDVRSALHIKLQNVSDTDRNGRIRTPLAVVINKIDSTPLLEERIGSKAVNAVMAADPETFTDPANTTDFLCRQFLMDYDMGDVVAHIEQDFATSRFFAVSSIGHTAGNGKGFEPYNVTDVVDWILDIQDPALGKALGARTYAKADLPVKEPLYGLFDQILENARVQAAAQAQAASQPQAAPSQAASQPMPTPTQSSSATTGVPEQPTAATPTPSAWGSSYAQSQTAPNPQPEPAFQPQPARPVEPVGSSPENPAQPETPPAKPKRPVSPLAPRRPQPRKRH